MELKISRKAIARRLQTDFAPLIPSFLLGILVSQIVMYVTRNHNNGTIVDATLSILGDSVGFYAGEFIRKSYLLRHTLPHSWARSKAAASWTVKQYFWAEIIDVWFCRAWSVTLMLSLINNKQIGGLVGNLLADVLFILVAVITGVEFSDFVIRLLKKPFSRQSAKIE